MTEQKRAAVEYTQEELETMVKAVLNGATIGDVATSPQDMLESLYSLGYNLYTSGNYKDAANRLFRAVPGHDHNDPRFWMGARRKPSGQRQVSGKPWTPTGFVRRWARSPAPCPCFRPECVTSKWGIGKRPKARSL